LNTDYIPPQNPLISPAFANMTYEIGVRYKNIFVSKYKQRPLRVMWALSAVPSLPEVLLPVKLKFSISLPICYVLSGKSEPTS